MRRLSVRYALCALFLLLSLPCADADEKADRDAAKREAEAAAAADRAAFEARVDTTIDKGVAWLKGQQNADGSYPGFVAENLKPRQYNIMDAGVMGLVMLTLAHCGVDADDPSIDKCMAYAKSQYAMLRGKSQVTVYTAATLIMALDKLYRGVPKQKPMKTDRYGKPVPPKPLKCRYPGWVKRWIKELADFIVKSQHTSGGWRYPGNPLESDEADTDLSNVQYALLGLEAAASCGIVAPKDTWTKAAAYVLSTQDAEGLETPVWIENAGWEPGLEDTPRFIEVGMARARGWTYVPGQQAHPTGSMTCAGVTCLALLKERLWLLGALDGPLRKQIDGGLTDGLAWLSDTFTVEDNPDATGTPQMWHYYYLYGLERTGSKTGLTYVGQHDWYREGADHLIGSQEADGGWKEADKDDRPTDATESPITQTCFALLFLKRSTRKPLIPMTPPIYTGGG